MSAESSRPGDRRVRVQRTQPQAFTVKAPKRLRAAPTPAASLLLLFAVLITAGTGLLMLPIATNDGSTTRFIDALFTATSAACVTGLVVLDTATHWSPFGQVVILLLIQVGGFGIMAGSTLLLSLFIGRRTTLRDRVLVQESLGGLHLGSITSLVKRIAIFTITCELIGAIVLGIAFTAGPEAGPPGDPLGIWWGIFHSVSAF
ncbi:MAG: potassium transporter TrkG, partial [Chloroflexota bacterium]